MKVNNVSYPEKIEFFNVALGERREDGHRGARDCFHYLRTDVVAGRPEVWYGTKSGFQARYEDAVVYRDRWEKDADLGAGGKPMNFGVNQTVQPIAQPVNVYLIFVSFADWVANRLKLRRAA